MELVALLIFNLVALLIMKLLALVTVMTRSRHACVLAPFLCFCHFVKLKGGCGVYTEGGV
jgi:hypothetical protein